MFLGTGGISVAAGSGNNVINVGTLALSGTQTWNNSAAGAGTLTINSTVSGTSPLTLQGGTTAAGAIILSGTNTYSGGVTLAGGWLYLNSPTALGAGPARSPSATAARSTTPRAAPVTIANNNPQKWNANFTFNGRSLEPGHRGRRDERVPNGYGQQRRRPDRRRRDQRAGYGLTMAGNGLLLLTGSNTYTGGTFISSGTLKLQTGAFATTPGTYSIASAGG